MQDTVKGYLECNLILCAKFVTICSSRARFGGVMILMPNDRYLLIHATGAGFWWDMHHLLGQVLAAELTQRIPVVYWGKNSLYSISEEINSFEQFFLPVSNYTIHDLVNENFTYFPPIGDSKNLFYNSQKTGKETLDLQCTIGCKANVLVNDFHVGIAETARYLQESHPLYDASPRDLYSQMLKKYIKLQPDVLDEINSFYRKYMKDKPVIAVHIRGSDKILEVSHLYELNKQYSIEIDNYLMANPSAYIFLMTDSREILSEYKKLYGNIVIHTDCKRVSENNLGVHYQDYFDKKRKGIEVIKDTWLAARCDYFIGNGHSNVSRGISELKDWQENSIKLLY